MQQLKETKTRWLQPEESTGEKWMLEQVALEQFVEGLPTGTSEWVWCHQQENHATAHGPCPCPTPHNHSAFLFAPL